MNVLPFHPLAEIFPLIEGIEFDELVESIKESGQREPIVTFEGSILDGRNRYRACQTAGVHPVIVPFKGTDPVKFVMDINLRRRHLNESQRGMIAAKLANIHNGRPSKTSDIPEVSQPEAAKILNVHRDTVTSAKRVLETGTDEEIKAVERGEVGVGPLARKIRARSPAPTGYQRGKSAVGKNPERIQNQRIRAQVWGQLRDALTNLTSLPIHTEVVAIARGFDRMGLVDAKLLRALEWLEGFSNAWTSRGDEGEAKIKDRKGNADAGDGGGVAGAQQPQSPAE